MEDKFWIFIYTTRWVLLSFAILFLTLMSCYVSAKLFDIELPSKEKMEMERKIEEKDNKKAYERVQKGKARKGDYEKAIKHRNKTMG